ncbi:hypothetical protein [Actinophytocola sp.]|uniref:hypothetical protein n=1 Tax=Actinophytocola sp. TaxID=1872138 RepID=UPI00389A8190
MSGGQIPVWITFALAAIALVGSVGGAWIGGRITARRDDRRWERELVREDLRWKREREREQSQRVHDLHLHWREQRIEAYASFIAAVDSFLSEVLVWVQEADERRMTRTDGGRLNDVYRTVESAHVAIEIVASNNVHACAADLLRVCDKAQVEMRQKHLLYLFGVSWARNEINRKFFLARAQAREDVQISRELFIQGIRAELLIELGRESGDLS